MGKNKRQIEKGGTCFMLRPFSENLERGSSMVETALMIALIAVGCFASIRSLGQTSNLVFENMQDNLAQGGITE